MVVTDYTQQILDNIRHNFDINHVQIGNSNMTPSIVSEELNSESRKLGLANSIEVEVMEYDWEKSLDSYHATGLESQLDLILVADCVYDDGLTIALVTVLERLLSMKNKGEKTNGTESDLKPWENTSSASTTSEALIYYPTAYVASTVRNKSTFDFFLKQLEQHQISHEFLDTSDKLSRKLFNYCSDDVVLSVLRHKLV